MTLTWSRFKRSIGTVFRFDGGRWVDPDELRDGLRVDRLLSPLRYDILLRLEFLHFYLENRKFFRDDVDALVSAARSTSYYKWFVSSDAVRRSRPDLLEDGELLQKRFAARVSRSAQLFESFLREGFRADQPIILKTASRILPASSSRGQSTGKSVSERYFLADGCHRVAILIHLGFDVLPRSYFKVRSYLDFSPFDSTSLLSRSLPVPPRALFPVSFPPVCGAQYLLPRLDPRPPCST